jgi:hypothetical protein
MDDKHIQFGNEGEELVPGKTENLSSALHEASRAAEVDAHLGDRDRDERGQPAQFDRRSGDVSGSGAAGEGCDQDAAGAATKADPQVPPR